MSPTHPRAFVTTFRLPLAALALLLAVPAGDALGADPPSDEASHPANDEAARVAAASVEAMGGETAWDALRFLRFDFFGFRTHHWDRHRGRHRLEGKTREGQSYVVLLDLDSKDGDAWLDGAKLEGEAEAEWLENAWGAWINDTYWLLMPLKLRDPGVHLTYEGREDVDGTAYEKVKLTFDSVGLTPGDTYWAWFNPSTGLMHRWAYHLQGWEADREPTAWDWLDWQTYGDVTLSSVRRNVGDGSERALGNIAVFDSLPDSVFTSPDPVAD